MTHFPATVRWKLVSHHGEQDEALHRWWKFSSRWQPRPFATEWHLYDMETDRTELNDVASKHPERVRRTAAAYDRWVARERPRLIDEVK